jgi:hypothetical protein
MHTINRKILLLCRTDTAQHVSGITMPIIRSPSNAIGASGFRMNVEVDVFSAVVVLLVCCVMHVSPRCAGDAGLFRSDSRAYFVMIIRVRCNRVRNVLRGQTCC